MKNFYKSTLILPILIFILAPIFVFAQAPTAPPGGPTSPPPYRIEIPSFLNPKVTSIPTLISVVIDDIVIPIGAVVAVLMIMYAGFQFVTAQGNESKIKDAKNSLLNASIGAAVLLGAKLIAAVVQETVTKL